MPVILDGAQGAGAVAGRRQGARLRRLRRRRPEVAVRRGRDRDALRAAGVRRARAHDRARPTGSFEDASRGLDSTLRAGGRRFDAPLLARGGRVLARRARGARGRGLRRVDGARRRPRRRASPPRSPSAGHTVAPRGRSTLVAFEYPEPAEARQRLAEAGDRRARPARPRRTCAPRSAPGTTSPTSSGCSQRSVKAVCVYCGSSFGVGPGLPRGDAGPRADARGARDPRRLRRRPRRPDGRARRRHARGRRRGRRRDPAALVDREIAHTRPDRAARRRRRCTSARR